jgi:hypothetical protein
MCHTRSNGKTISSGIDRSPMAGAFHRGCRELFRVHWDHKADKKEFEAEEGGASGGSSTLVDSLETQQRYYEKYQQEHYEEKIDEGNEEENEGVEGNEVSLNN